MATTYTEESSAHGRAVKAVCTTGTEAAGVLTATTKGLVLAGLDTCEIRVESTTGVAFTAGTLEAYLQNPISNRWTRCRALDRSVAASLGETFSDFDINDGMGRLAFLPNGL